MPPHRYTPLKTKWNEIYQPIVEHMKVKIRFNPRKKCVELQSGEQTDAAGALQKSADFVRGFMLGFEIRVTRSKVFCVRKMRSFFLSGCNCFAPSG